MTMMIGNGQNISPIIGAIILILIITIMMGMAIIRMMMIIFMFMIMRKVRIITIVTRIATSTICTMITFIKMTFFFIIMLISVFH